MIYEKISKSTIELEGESAKMATSNIKSVLPGQIRQVWDFLLDEEAICHLFGRCVVFCGVGAFLLLYGSFNNNDFILCTGLGIIGIMVVLSIIVPKINIKKYRK